MNELTFSALRRANLARIPEYRNKQGEPAHGEPDGSDWSRADWLQAVVGELGEYANLAKKILRGDFDMSDPAEAERIMGDLADELADVVCYLDILALQWDVDLGAAVESKFNRVSERVGSSVRLKGPDAIRTDRRAI